MLRYISVRGAAALITGFVVSLIIAPPIMAMLRKRGLVELVRKTTKADCPNLYDMHKEKEGTPTMGGLIILGAFFTSTILFTRLDNPMILAVLTVTLFLGALGFVDDYTKVGKKIRKGLSSRFKFFVQIVLGFGFGLFMYYADLGIYYEHAGVTSNTNICVPFFKSIYPALGILFIPYAILVLTATSNAVNLTDGLDGLAIGITVIVTMCFGIIAYIVGRTDFAPYLILPYVPGAGEIAILLAALVGAGLGFLWFNAHPAEVFMGDTGSQAIGGILGASALLIKQELLLVIIGGMFVLETLSVVLQVFSYKTRGKRIFKMAPIHHHFEKSDWAESKIFCRFWIITGLLALIGMSSLKLR
jgi:phospho-N-acetylmuramoyl-pentapeptide-transferase